LPALLLLVWGGGVGGLGTLLGPEETPVVGASWCRSWSCRPNAWADPWLCGGLFVWWWVWGSGCGCVLSVA
jgi:hypothetical protein